MTRPDNQGDLLEFRAGLETGGTGPVPRRFPARRGRNGRKHTGPVLADSGLRGISAAAPMILTDSGFVHAGRCAGSGTVNGATALCADLVSLTLPNGRFVSNLDAGSFRCAVGAKIAAATLVPALWKPPA